MNRLDVVAWFQIGIDDRMHLLAAMMSDKNLAPFFLVKISQCLRQNRLVGKVFKTNHATYNCRRIQVKETDGRTSNVSQEIVIGRALYENHGLVAM